MCQPLQKTLSYASYHIYSISYYGLRSISATLENMTKNPDDELFKKAMLGVKKLTHTKIIQRMIPHKKRIQTTKSDETPHLNISEYMRYEEVDADALLYFARQGLQHKVLRKLRRGQYNTESTLDLHGKTVSESKEALSRFLAFCQQHGFRHVLIIHGKGRSHTKPILKNKLNHWLREIDLVLAFCSALNKDGSTGALYVILRRNRDP